MAQIPGNELFPDQKRNYGSDNVQTVTVTDDSFDDGDYTAWYKPGNARAVFVVGDGDIDFYMRPSGSEDPADYRKMVLAGQVAPGTSANVGIISGDVMPHEFALKSGDTDNNYTLYFVY